MQIIDTVNGQRVGWEDDESGTMHEGCTTSPLTFEFEESESIKQILSSNYRCLGTCGRMIHGAEVQHPLTVHFI
jgi:hypothetical protein